MKSGTEDGNMVAEMIKQGTIVPSHVGFPPYPPSGMLRQQDRGDEYNTGFGARPVYFGIGLGCLVGQERRYQATPFRLPTLDRYLLTTLGCSLIS